MSHRHAVLLFVLIGALAAGCGAVEGGSDASINGADASNNGADASNNGADASSSGPDASSVDAVPIPDAQPPDAEPPDAQPPRAVYDVAFISDFSFTSNTVSIGSWGVVVAKGSRSLDMTTAKIVSVTDDHPTAIINVTVGVPNSGGTLLPNQYAGNLSPLANTEIIDSGVVTEPKNSMSFSFRMSLQDLPTASVNINVVAVFSVEGTEISIPIIVRVGASSTSFNQASRISTN